MAAQRSADPTSEDLGGAALHWKGRGGRDYPLVSARREPCIGLGYSVLFLFNPQWQWRQSAASGTWFGSPGCGRMTGASNLLFIDTLNRFVRHLQFLFTFNM